MRELQKDFGVTQEQESLINQLLTVSSAEDLINIKQAIQDTITIEAMQKGKIIIENIEKSFAELADLGFVISDVYQDRSHYNIHAHQIKIINGTPFVSFDSGTNELPSYIREYI